MADIRRIGGGSRGGAFVRRLAGRLLGLVAVLLIVSFLIFGSIHIAPGDPVSFLLKGHPVTPAARAAIAKQYHLNDPFFQQYLEWLNNVLHGNFGRSVQYHQEVSSLISSRLPVTLFLIVYAGILMIVAGVAVGIVSALKPGFLDRFILVCTGVATATPSFVAGIGLTSLFAVKLGWFPTFGAGSGFLDRLHHLTLPAIALAFTLGGLLARVTRSAMLDELGREHVEAARARGVAESGVVRRHALRNALGPIATVSGTMVAGLFVSTSIVETFFSCSGVGSLLISSVTTKDFPVVQAISLIIVFAFVVVNLLVDVVQPLIDPRLAAEGPAKRRPDVAAPGSPVEAAVEGVIP